MCFGFESAHFEQVLCANQQNRSIKLLFFIDAGNILDSFETGLKAASRPQALSPWRLHERWRAICIGGQVIQEKNVYQTIFIPLVNNSNSN